MSETVKISTTMRPGDEIEVGESEFRDLAAQGLIAKVNGRSVTEEKAKEKANNA